MKQTVLGLVLAFVFAPCRAAVPPSAPGQESTALASIKATGSARFSSEQIAQASGLKAGASVTRDNFQAAADRLAQLGLFSSVQYRFATQSGGVRVEYQVADAPSVAVLFDNFPWFSDDEVSAAIEKAVVLFDGRAPSQGTILDEIAVALENLLAARGIQAKVTHSLLRRPGGEGDVQRFRVEGPSMTVEGVEFTDSLAQADRAIQQELSQLIGKPFSRSEAERFAFERVRPLYLERAHLSVKIGPPAARFAGNPNAPAPDRVVVRIPIVPGPEYKWAGATWSGNTVFTSAQLEALIGLADGASADGMKLAAAWNRISEAYGQKGYLDAKIEPTPQPDEKTGRVSYRITISEGHPYRMGKLVLTGLSLEGEKRVRAAWKIAPGAVFDRSFFDQFVATGARQAFGDLPYTYEKIGRLLDTHPQEGTVDVLLDFQ